MKRQTSVKRRRRVITFGILIGLAVIGVGSWWVLRDELPGSPVDPGTPIPASTALTADERAFYDYVGPRLRALTAESEVLVSLGQSRSRNIVELRRRGDRVNEIAGQIDHYIESSGMPDRFASAMSLYNTGIEAVRRAEAATRSALLSFDWDTIARAVEVMDLGTRELEQARTTLEHVAGDGADSTPVATTGAPVHAARGARL